MIQALEAGDIMIDIGANGRSDTLLASHLVGREGEVHAIEASPHLYHQLTETLAQHHATNVTPHHAAIRATVCSVPLFAHDPAGAHPVAVPGRPLAAIIPESTIVSARLIRIDADGAEWPVVLGFAELLPHLASYAEVLIPVSAESLHGQGVSVAAFLDLFRKAGFAARAIGNRDFEPWAATHRPPNSDNFGQLDILFRRD
jgi:FkbM family methyltransferase